MQVDEARKEQSIKGKNGIPFLMASLIVWFILTFLFLLDIGFYLKNILLFIAALLIFPLSLVISSLFKINQQLKDNPLRLLRVYLNLAPIIYFPLLFWMFDKNPERMIVFFAIITGAHFFPYGWLYHTPVYSIMAPVTAFMMMRIGWNLPAERLWVIPLSMAMFLYILIYWLVIDYRRKM